MELDVRIARRTSCRGAARVPPAAWSARRDLVGRLTHNNSDDLGGVDFGKRGGRNGEGEGEDGELHGDGGGREGVVRGS